jgi:hypothetical protein
LDRRHRVVVMMLVLTSGGLLVILGHQAAPCAWTAAIEWW